MPLTSALVRQRTIQFACNTGAGHLASSLSTVEILTILFNDFLSFIQGEPEWEDRDRLVFSKGHGAYALYVILNELGFLPDQELHQFNTENSSLKGCMVQNHQYMIEASTGSLGHGLPLAVGMAKSFQIQKMKNKVVCIVGDGEMQEGSNYEALILASQFKLNNLLVIIDANNLQAMDFVADVGMDNNHLSRILKEFTPENFFEIDGHNETELKNAMTHFFKRNNSDFTIIVAHTTKGKGLPMIENTTKYHYRCPTEDGYIYVDSEEV